MKFKQVAQNITVRLLRDDDNFGILGTDKSECKLFMDIIHSSIIIHLLNLHFLTFVG